MKIDFVVVFGNKFDWILYRLNANRKVDTKKLMKLVSAKPLVQDDPIIKDMGLVRKESLKNKENGRISMPEQSENKEVQSKYENLRRMPFSLNDPEDEEINSPAHRDITDRNDFSNSPSLEIQMEHDDDLFDVNEQNMFPDFEFTEFSDYKKNESEKHNKSNQMIDSSNLYLNLSNKVVQCKDDLNKINMESKQKKKGNKSFNYNQATEKTGHNTGAITWTASNKKKNTSKHMKTEVDHDITGNSYLKHKSLTTQKKNLYSDFDEQSDHDSGNTEVKHSFGLSNNRINNIKPGIIKGFCSSFSSASEIDKQETPEIKEIEFKHNFYNSGDTFNAQKMSHKSFTDPVKPKIIKKFDKSHKNLTLGFQLSLDSSVEEMNKTER